MKASPESSNLIKLIRSLKQGEKRIVTLELARYKKENNLLKLYHFISNSDSVTDADIRKKIKDRKFISQLNINKHKLYNTLLEILQQAHQKNSPYHRIFSMVQQAYLLYSKGLIKAKDELLFKAIPLAEKYELREMHLQLIHLQQYSQANDSVSFIRSAEKAYDRFIQERKLHQLFNSCLTFESIPGTRLNSKQRSQLKKLMDEALAITCDSFTASYYRLRICFSVYAIPGEHGPSSEYAQKIIRLFQQFPYMLEMENWRIEYIESFRNFIPAFTFFGQAAQREFIYNEAKRLDVPERFKASLLINILDSYIQTGAFSETEKNVKEIEKNRAFYESHLSPYNRHILYFNLSILNFGMNRYSKSLFWLNEMINDGTEMNHSLAIMTRLLRLVVFYELKHHDLLENQIRSASRFIAKLKDTYQFDSFLLKSFRKLINLSSKTEQLDFFKQLRKELLLILKDGNESRALGYFDFISWIESKIESRPFEHIVKEKSTLHFGKTTHLSR